MTHEFIENILAVSRSVKPRHINNVALKLCEESGELAKEINIETGFLNKLKGDDGIIGEACDVINCAIDIIYLSNPDITAEEINACMVKKLDKWKKVASPKI